jgi:hypothetical protein
MTIKTCLYCGKELSKSPNDLFCNKKCQDKAMIEDPEYYFEEINRIKTRKLDYKKKLLNAIEENKKENMIHYRENTSYVIRHLQTKNKTGDAFGITIPKSIAKNHTRMECKIIDDDLIILVPQKVRPKRKYTKKEVIKK